MQLARWMTRLLAKPARSSRSTSPAPRGKFWTEVLEDRINLANFATGTAVGEAPIVRVFDAATQQPVAALNAYTGGYTGGVNVAMGDVTGDGVADIITGTATTASHVKVFDGATFQEVRSFLAFPGFPGGINVAAGDINGDGKADIVASVANGGPPHVKAFSGANGAELASFFAYDQGFTGGVRVAVGDVDGDGKADIVTGSGPGAGGHVKAFSGANGSVLRSFLAYPGFNGGVNVAVGDIDGDGKADIVTGSGPGVSPHVKAFSGANGNQIASFFAYDQNFKGGVLVGVNADGDIATGASGTAHLKTFDGVTHAELSSAFSSRPVTAIAAPSNPNVAPVITSGATASVAENQTAAYTTAATDANTPAQTLTYSITGGADAAKFAINAATGVVTFLAAPDAEAPTDVGANNVYEITVQVSDGFLTATKNVSITVTGVSEFAPVITSNGGGTIAAINAAENQTAVTTVSSTDADVGTGSARTYSISGPDAAKFAINATTGVLTFLAAPNFESPTDVGGNNVYDVTVTVSDGTLTDVQDLSITVTDANDAPVISSNGGGETAAVSAAENQTAVTTVTATDEDAGATRTYSISGGADAVKFSINASTGVLTFIAPPDFETPTDAGANNVYDVIVQVSDGTATDTQTISVTVTGLNDNNPVITSNGGGATAAVNAAENQTVVTTVTATDTDLPAQTLTYSISGGADAAKFTINATTGVLTFVTAPDFETPTDANTDNVYDVIVQVSDGTLTDTQTISVTVTGVNDNNPVITSNGGGATAAVNAAENQTAVTTVTATDTDLPGDTLTYTIIGGADAAKFSINATTGVLTFVAAPDFETPTDAGANNVYDVIVRVSDGTLTDVQAIAVTVTNVNEAPVITSNGGGANAAINAAENQTAVTTVTATDVDAGTTLTYSITGGADMGLFTINSSTGVLTFLAAPDFEAPGDTGTDNVYDLVVTVSDGTLTDTQTIAVTVTDVGGA
ncbi:Cadherin domain protein [Gemmata sp. SH-PL17]|uniref:cadherin domain-containing protein n=1 Tax=Gemmata sp. SH-PL17 TaxID=1630693 RepID=UPI00078BA6FE|nr:cadherin domain-containing protein [Gemmata sp. SH-PL17]AMV27035.1 Cadherin domain protein [Gemmata sp. SH-PL17]